ASRIRRARAVAAAALVFLEVAAEGRIVEERREVLHLDLPGRINVGHARGGLLHDRRVTDAVGALAIDRLAVDGELQRGARGRGRVGGGQEGGLRGKQRGGQQGEAAFRFHARRGKGQDEREDA